MGGQEFPSGPGNCVDIFLSFGGKRLASSSSFLLVMAMLVTRLRAGMRNVDVDVDDGEEDGE